MRGLLLHHNGAWNVFSTVADGPCFVSALTEAQLRQLYKEEYGDVGLQELQARMERARGPSGCSSGIGQTLHSCIEMYRANQGKECTDEEFIAEFLTLPPPTEEPAPVEKSNALHTLEHYIEAFNDASDADRRAQADELRSVHLYVQELEQELAVLKSTDREVCLAQAVEFAQYVVVAAKGKMEDRAKHFLSMPYAQEVAKRLNLTLTGK